MTIHTGKEKKDSGLRILKNWQMKGAIPARDRSSREGKSCEGLAVRLSSTTEHR